MELEELDLGNPQEDTPKPRVKKIDLKGKLKRLLLILAAVLLVVTVALLWDSTTFDGLRRRVIYARTEKDAAGCAEIYQYAQQSGAVFSSVDGSLIRVSPTQLQIIGGDGGVRYTTALQFKDCAVDSSRSRAVAYDIGGTVLYVLDGQGLLYQLSCDGEILSANLNEHGDLAVVTNKSGYKAAVYVYDSKGEMTFEFDSSEHFVMTAAVSENGKELAAVTLGQSDGTFVSSVVLYRMNSDEPYAACDLTGDAVYDIESMDGLYCAVSENALYFLKANGDMAASYSYADEFLRRCCLSEDGYAALLLGTYKSGSQGRLVTVNTKGEEIASQETDSEIISLSAAGQYVAALFGDHLILYRKDLKEVDALPDVSTAGQVLMREDGSAVLVGNENASVYLP